MKKVSAKDQGTIFVFSAPSGAGKTTLLNRLREKMPELVYSISATTRKPRNGEISGVHYFFLTEEEFKNRIANNQFAEWAKVHENYYGTPREYIDNTISGGSSIVMDIDVQGKLQFDQIYPDAIGILVMPPSIGELERRLRGRKSETEQTITTRLNNAQGEIEFARSQGKYEYTVINENLDDAEREILGIISTHLDKKQ